MKNVQRDKTPSPTLSSTRPPRAEIGHAGANHEREARESVVMASFLVPGRPHTKFGTRSGSAYFARVKEAAEGALKCDAPLCNEGFIGVTFDLYFAASEEAPADFGERPEDWEAFNIPRADAGAGVLMSALKGYLYRSSRQVQPLVVNRFVRSKQDLEKNFGAESRRGCAVVHYALPVKDSRLSEMVF